MTHFDFGLIDFTEVRKERKAHHALVLPTLRPLLASVKNWFFVEFSGNECRKNNECSGMLGSLR